MSRGGLERPREYKSVYFFFQEEDGIRDGTVTGVQTCALPILKCKPILPPGKRRKKKPVSPETSTPINSTFSSSATAISAKDSSPCFAPSLNCEIALFPSPLSATRNRSPSINKRPRDS